MKITDAQIDAAMEIAMRKSIEREPEGPVREQMFRDLERYRAGDHLPPDVQAKFRLAVRDFIAALVPTPKVRRKARRGRA